MSANADKRSPDEYIETASTGVTRESFENGFRSFKPTERLIALIDQGAMDILFSIADDYLHHDTGVREMDRRSMGQDYGNWQKLLAGAEPQLEELQQFMKSFIRSGRPRTSSRARAMLKETKAFQRKLDDRFFSKEYRIRAQQAHLSVLKIKTAVYEYTLDLEAFIRDEFPTLGKLDRETLIAAAMAGARIYTASERNDPFVVDRIPMQVSRAKQYYKKCYSDPGAGRVYSYRSTRKKVKNKQDKEKKQK